MLLNIGQEVTCRFSKENLRVIKELGSGGQGVVYLVKGPKSGERALKWYYDTSATTEQLLAIDALIRKGAPDGDVNSSFVWPLDIIEDNGSFGYMMKLVDFKKYITVGKMLSGKAEYQPTQEMKCLISLKLVSAFAKLHACGYCYRDINENNIMFNIKTGEVAILDNDNVGFEGLSKSNVLGVPDFMAPEILKGEAMPSKYTDYHSLAVYLFRFWMWHHPIEGKKADSVHCWDRDAKVKIFGLEPVFIFHPTDKSNSVPNDPDYQYINKLWQACPEQLRKLFTETFVNGINDPSKRVIETRWIKALGLLFDVITNCPNDGAENFWHDDKAGGERTIKCWHCKKEYKTPIRLKIKNKNNNLLISNIIAKPSAKLLNRHMTSANVDPDKAQNVLGEMVQNPKVPGMWGLRNLSESVWKFTNPRNETVDIPKGRTVPAFEGNIIDFGNGLQGSFEA
jgi:eukaryotic-like serine/threonine-protein kinase